MSLLSRIKDSWKGLKQRRQDARERKEQHDILFNHLKENGNLCVSAMWYYTREQTDAFIDMILDESKNPNGNTYRELTLLERLLTMPQMKQELTSTTSPWMRLMDLGCGNGLKAAMIKKLAPYRKLVYVPIDASVHMGQCAIDVMANIASCKPIDLGFGRLETLEAWNDTLVPGLEMRRLLDRRAYWTQRLRHGIERLLQNLPRAVNTQEAETATSIDELVKLRDKALSIEQDTQSILQGRKLTRKERSELSRIFEVRHSYSGDKHGIRKYNMYKRIFSPIYRLVRIDSLLKFDWPFLLADYATGSMTRFFPFRSYVGAPSTPYGDCYDDYFAEGVISDFLNAISSRHVLSTISSLTNPVFLFSRLFKRLFLTHEEYAKGELASCVEYLKKRLIASPCDNLTLEDSENYVSKYPVVADFFSKQLGTVCKTLDHSIAGTKPTLYMLLGQTLGNFAPAQQGELLRSFYSNMDSGDYLLVGIECRPVKGRTNDKQIDQQVYEQDIADMVKRYQDGDAFLRNSTRNLDIPDDALDFKVVYEENAIQMRFDVTKPVTVRHGKKQVELKAGQRIPIAFSYKFTPNEAIMLIKSNGFTLVGEPAINISPYRQIEGNTIDGRPEYMVMMVRK